MAESTKITATGGDAGALAEAMQSESTRPKLLTHELPFVVRVVRTPEQLSRVCALRAEAYGRRNPALGALLAQPEPADLQPGILTLVAEDKQTGEAIGSIRIHTNIFQALPMEAITPLPPRMDGCVVAEVCRFAVKEGFTNSIVRLVLVKAGYLYAYANQVQHVILLARNPLNKIYQSFGYSPMFGAEETWLPVSYASDLEHSFLSMDVIKAERLWHEMAHPFYDFMSRTFHPDIQIFSAVNSAWNRPRLAAQDAPELELARGV